MKKEMSIKKIVGFFIVMLCMMYALFFYVKDTEATNNTIIYESGYEYTTSKYDVDGVKIAPDAPSGTSGYLFAGWYTSPDDGVTYEPVAEPQDGTTYYAKFVPQEVLGVKAQVTTALIADAATSKTDNSAIRFITTVDSDQYKEVGFNIARPGKDAPYDTGNGVVYNTLYAVDATRDNKGEPDTKYKPTMFHEQSTYFKTWTIKKIPDTYYDSDFTVTPYWITLDGTRVEGTTGIKTVNLGRSWIYVNSESTSEVELGTLNAPYKTMANAVAHDTELNLKVILASDVTVSGTINIVEGENITIVDDGTSTVRNIERGTSFDTSKAGLLFAVKEGASLTFDSTGTDETPLLIVDGSKGSYEQIDTITGNWAMVQSKGTLNVNAGVKFTNNASGKDGGAISVTGGNLTVNGGTFSDNDVLNSANERNGGAISIAGNATAIIKNTTFVGNTSKTHGGAIIIAEGSQVTITDTKFDGCQSGEAGQGGAILNNGTLTLTGNSSEKAVFCNNVASNGAGGAIYTYGTLTVTGYTFKENSTKNGGAIYVKKGATSTTITNCVFDTNTVTNAGSALNINANCTLSAPSGSVVSDVFKGYTASATKKTAIFLANAQLTVNGFTLTETDYFIYNNTATVVQQ